MVIFRYGCNSTRGNIIVVFCRGAPQMLSKCSTSAAVTRFWWPSIEAQKVDEVIRFGAPWCPLMCCHPRPASCHQLAQSYWQVLQSIDTLTRIPLPKYKQTKTEHCAMHFLQWLVFSRLALAVTVTPLVHQVWGLGDTSAEQLTGSVPLCCLSVAMTPSPASYPPLNYVLLPQKNLHWLLSLISLLILFLCQWDEGRRLKCWKLNMFPILQSTTVFVNTVIISLSIRAESTDIINFSPKHWKGFRSIHYSLNHKYHQSFQDPSNIQI